MQQYPSNPLVLFYYGLNRYHLGDLTGAASALSFSLQADLENEEAADHYFRLHGLGEAPLARYYLSLPYERLNPTLSSHYRKIFLKDLQAWREGLEQKPTDLSSVSPLSSTVFTSIGESDSKRRPTWQNLSTGMSAPL